MIDWLDENGFPEFPPPRNALTDPNGLLAAGGGMSPLWLDCAYRAGIFPWHDPDEVRLWWSPAPRAVITPTSFRIPRSVRKVLKRPWNLTTNLAFERVMTACSAPRSATNGVWINPQMIRAYTRLHHAGRALSAEVWDENGELCGGFYGLQIGAVFFGESMFSQRSGASQFAFARLAPLLFRQGIQLIDCQMKTDHLARFGIVELEREAFEQQLADHINTPTPAPLPGFC